MRWVVASLLLSVALTVGLNAVLRAFPDAGRRTFERLERRVDADEPTRSGVRVWFPWKAMLVISVVATIVINLLI